jgi:Radical SAM superfamily
VPNLLLTYKCNRSCPYCFAQERQQTLGPDSEQLISWKNLVIAANYFADTPEKTITLLGGEPTLHPEFINIYRYLLARDFTVRVFSNGCLDPEKIEDLGAALVVPRSRFIINVNEERDRADFETKMQNQFFSKLGMASSLSFNLFRTDPHMDFLLDIIGKYQLRPKIRLGLAHPMAGTPNDFLSPKHYGKLGETIAQFAKRCDRQGVILTLDCGFTLCDFTDEQLGTLLRANAILKFGCGPIIDVGPDLSTWACFPLSGLQTQPLEEYPSFEALQRFYTNFIRAETRQRGFAGLYEACEPCRYKKRGQCSGGCHAYAFAEQR